MHFYLNILHKYGKYIVQIDTHTKMDTSYLKYIIFVNIYTAKLVHNVKHILCIDRVQAR